MARLNEDGVEMFKNFYEVAICIQPEGSTAEDDYESAEFEAANNYHDAIRRAKNISKQREYQGIRLKEAHVVCYYADEDCSYNMRYRRVYQNGKYLYTWE